MSAHMRRNSEQAWFHPHAMTAAKNDMALLKLVGDKVMTTKEIGEITGWSRMTLIITVRRMVEAGNLDRCGFGQVRLAKV